MVSYRSIKTYQPAESAKTAQSAVFATKMRPKCGGRREERLDRTDLPSQPTIAIAIFWKDDDETASTTTRLPCTPSREASAIFHFWRSACFLAALIASPS